MTDEKRRQRHRIGKVTTRAGDSGNSKLATGRTVAKHAPEFQAIGSVDELNSHVGMLVSQMQAGDAALPACVEDLESIQQALFDIGAVLAMEGQFDAPDFEQLELRVEALNGELPPLTEFVLPGGGIPAAQSHICRTVCRRAETDVWRLLQNQQQTQDNLRRAAAYLNRLSDYFFVLARTLTATTETQWQGPVSS